MNVWTYICDIPLKLSETVTSMCVAGDGIVMVTNRGRVFVLTGSKLQEVKPLC